MASQNKFSRYEEIALDLANAIYKGNYKEGEKLHGRSTLAGMYNVSPETIRRAIKLLEDVDVVQSSRGSGIIILSRDKAFRYINKFKNINSVASLKASLVQQMSDIQKSQEDVMTTIEKLIDYAGRYSNTTAITPLEIEITDSCTIIGKSIGGVNFWQHTGGTIVGIRRDDETILSPGPYSTFDMGDVLLVVGDEKVYNAVRLFLEE